MYLSPGSTFILSEHLQIIVFGETNKSNEAVYVSVSTFRKHNDPTTILNVGDHPFIRHKSFIRYEFATIIELVKLSTILSNNPSLLRPRLKTQILEKIQEDIYRSPHTPDEVFYTFDGPG